MHNLHYWLSKLGYAYIFHRLHKCLYMWTTCPTPAIRWIWWRNRGLPSVNVYFENRVLQTKLNKPKLLTATLAAKWSAKTARCEERERVIYKNKVKTLRRRDKHSIANRDWLLGKEGQLRGGQNTEIVLLEFFKKEDDFLKKQAIAKPLQGQWWRWRSPRWWWWWRSNWG